MAVIIVGVPGDEVLRERMTTLAEAHRRREALFGGAPGEVVGPVLGEDWVPTPQALDAALDGPSWGEKVDAKHRKAIRRIPGAIIHFPLEDGGTVDTFITDWSPLPGACAIAVHPGHPLARGEGFTGHYARHPLTGDLIGVWTAGWVRPDFGTGAVVVNPAHSEADLDFARHAGLPIRFALADKPPTSDPDTWPQPPVIKRGVTRAGQPFDEAAQTYLEELQAHGHAELTSLAHLTKRYPNPELLQTLLTDPCATIITTADAIPKDLLWARVALAGLDRVATPRVITDIPAHKPQQVESALRSVARKEPGEPDHELLKALEDGDFAAAFTALRSTKDRKSAETAVKVLFGAEMTAP
ncbi:hypothetical protein ABZX92_20890 [Lentzea sp. NPDC006480]|uniref:hypothetical protein n=1 Tax=Lentzea sp. NPDC006480 TaxID=3157176 RepID=UPI0033A1D714